MKGLIQRIVRHANFSKVLNWGKLITITGGAQVLVQGTGFISGILTIRLLSTQEYAYFTLANTMLGTMVMLADSGISNGVMAESGKVWQEKSKLANVLATGLSLRRQFGIISLLVTLPVLGYLLLSHGASWLITLLILLALIPAFFAALSDSLLEIVPKLHQTIQPLQRNQIEVSLGRVALNTALLFFMPYTVIALLANGIPRMYGNLKLKRLSALYTTGYGRPDIEVQEKIIKGVKRTLPIVLYHCISGQLSIWLISLFGATEGISQIGALGRLSMLFGLFTTIFSTLVVPRFSRMAESRKSLMQYFLAIQLSVLTVSITLLGLVKLFSAQILWVLGDKYSGLNYELFLIALINCIGLLGAVCSQLVLSRGWFLKPYFLIGLNFISTVTSFVFFDMHSLVDVLRFTLTISILAYFMDLIYGIISINKIEYKAQTLQVNA